MSDTDIYTSADVAKMVRDLSDRLGGVGKAAKAIIVNHSYLCNVMDGSSEPGPAILDYFGLRKESKGIFVSALGDGYILAGLHKEKPRRDPMKMLHLDYVHDKLAGRVKIPRGNGKQIVLGD